jgi:hypothetical protein
MHQTTIKKNIKNTVAIQPQGGADFLLPLQGESRDGDGFL